MGGTPLNKTTRLITEYWLIEQLIDGPKTTRELMMLFKECHIRHLERMGGMHFLARILIILRNKGIVKSKKRRWVRHGIWLVEDTIWEINK